MSNPVEKLEKESPRDAALPEKAVLVCHCLLDPLTRARGTKRITRDIIKVFVDLNISIIQLPCPEMLYGFFREPRSKEEYDIPAYREHCRKLAEHIAETVIQYSEHFDILGLVSVGGSPSCGCQRTHLRGEHVQEPGIFIEELQAVFKEKNVEMKVYDHELLEAEHQRNQFLSLGT